MPTLVFCCGAECGDAVPGTAPGGATRHWDAKSGTPLIDTVIKRGVGGASYKFASSASVEYLEKTYTQSLGVARVYVYFQTLPAVGDPTEPFVTFTMTGGLNYSVGYDPNTGTLYASAGVLLGTSFVHGPAVTTGVWYRIDIIGNCGIATSTTDWSVDGVAQTQATRNITPGAFIAFRVGCSAQTTDPTSYTVNIDDIAISATSGDYPLGPGAIIGLKPRADGTHSFSGPSDFKYENTTVMPSTSPTDTWSHINDPLDSSQSKFLSAAAVAAGEYLEWLLDAAPTLTSINGVEVFSSHFAAGSNANKQTLRLLDGATTVDVFTDADFSVSAGTYCFQSKHYPTAPSGGAWSKTKLDALKFRWGSSWTAVDIVPAPFIDALCLEVDYVPAGVTATVAQTSTGAAQAATAAQQFTATVGQTSAGAAQQIAAGQGYTGTVAQAGTSGAQAATGAQKFTATAAQTSPAQAQAISGSNLLAIAATATQTQSTAAQAAAGVQKFTGAVTQTSPAQAQSASGTALLAITATATQTQGNAAQAAAGTEVFTGATTQANPAQAQAATGIQTFTGAVTGVAAGATQQASAAQAHTGTIGQTSTGAAQQATATQELAATVSQASAGVAQAATTGLLFTASAAQTSAAAAEAALAALAIQGTVEQAQAGAAQQVGVSGVTAATVVQTGASAAQAGLGTFTLNGQTTQTTSGAAQQATGTVAFAAGVVQTSTGAAQQLAAAQQPAPLGTVAQTGASATQQAAAALLYLGAVAQTSGDTAQAAAAMLPVVLPVIFENVVIALTPSAVTVELTPSAVAVDLALSDLTVEIRDL